jgi:hypothetical protein
MYQSIQFSISRFPFSSVSDQDVEAQFLRNLEPPIALCRRLLREPMVRTVEVPALVESPPGFVNHQGGQPVMASFRVQLACLDGYAMNALQVAVSLGTPYLKDRFKGILPVQPPVSHCHVRGHRSCLLMRF